MASITLGGNEIHTSGELIKIGEKIPGFRLVKNDLSETTLDDFKGMKLILNIFPSLETGICSASVRSFNKAAAGLKNTAVLCISRDLPFTQAKFCGTEGIDNAITLSDFRTGKFGKDYNLEIIDGSFSGLLSRVVIVTDESGKVIYREQVPEIAQEPDYEAALAALK